MVTRARSAELRSKAESRPLRAAALAFGDLDGYAKRDSGDPGAIRTRDPELRRLGGLSKFMSII
jgi:hypothetical protein